MKQTYYLSVPPGDFLHLEFIVEFIEKEGIRWIKMSAVADDKKVIAWSEWKIEKVKNG